MFSRIVQDLVRRRVPHFLGFYLAASWGVVEVVDLLVDRYRLSPQLLDLSIVALLTLIPTVALLAYSHGGPGEQRWTKAEKIGIPTNLLVSAGVLLFMFSGKDLSADRAGASAAASGPAGPDSEIIGPAFDHNETAKPGHGGGDGTEGGGGKALLFKDPTVTCVDGATDTGDRSFGHVSWDSKVFVGAQAGPGGDHVHYKLQLKDVDPGVYTIFGNQRENSCNMGNVSIGTFTVKKNGQGSGSGQYHFPVHTGGLTTHVWMTVSGQGEVFRTPAVTMVIPEHVE